MLDVETLLERHINARGGLRAILNITSLYQVGTMTDRRGEAVQIEAWRKRPDLLRVHFKAGDVTGTEGWDGTRAWEHFAWRVPDPAYVDGKASRALQRRADFDGPLVQAKQKGHTIRPLGECVVAGLPVYGLSVTLRDGSTTNYYLHKQTYMVAVTDTVRQVHAGDDAHTTTQFTDYRLVAGVMFPHYWVETSHDAGHNETFAWKEYRANAPVDDAYFALQPVRAPEG